MSDRQAPRPAAGSRTVAIIGSRAATVAGARRAHELAAGLADDGVAIVSGGALGIDAAAHEGALAVGGATWAVLGCGFDTVYPDRHADLFARIVRTGGLLSEYAPPTPVRRGQFPRRNRIIAALADVIVVVEAGVRSGALGTVRAAGVLGLPVAAVPGSAGADRLIGEGAVPVRTPADVSRLLAGELPQGAGSGTYADHEECAPAMRRLLGILAETGAAADVLSQRLGYPLPEVMSMLGQAEIEGWIRRVPGGAYEVTRGH